MTNEEDETRKEAFELITMEGLRIMVGPGDRNAVIRKAMVNLKITIDGCSGQPASRDMFDALARQCSIFLRKMAVGDDRNPPLLDVKTCESAGILFHKLRVVRGERQSLPVVDAKICNSALHLTLTNPATGNLLGEMHNRSDVPWQFSIHSDWPLPGMVEWVGIPTPETPWTISPDGLFDLGTSVGHDCSRWLGQVLVLFDGRSVTLGNAIRAVINAEGAHAPISVSLMRPQDENTRRVPDTIRNPGAYILLSVVACGIPYSHVIAIETGLYLYSLVAQSGLVEQFKDVNSVPAFGITYAGPGSPLGRTPLGFEGAFVLPILSSPSAQQEKHAISAPRPR